MVCLPSSPKSLLIPNLTTWYNRDVNVSHITTGYIVNSPEEGFVRVDQSPDGVLSSSFFNYANISDTGLVDNTLTTYSPDSDVLEVWRDYVNSNFPIFPEDILVASGAVFTGLVERTQVGKVAGWSLMYQGVIPVTVYVNSCRVVVGYDYFSPELRTGVTTQFFNVKA